MTENEANVKTGFGVTREEVEHSLQKAYEEKVQLTRTIDSLDGSIQVMEYILNGPAESPDETAEKIPKKTRGRKKK